MKRGGGGGEKGEGGEISKIRGVKEK